MDLSGLHTSASPPPQGAAFAGHLDADPAFRELLGQLGREVAAPMASALERVNSFAASGRIDRTGLRALRDEIERARRIGLSAQQLCRFASGRVRQHQERLNLSQKLHEALTQRGREAASRGIDLRQDLKPAEVIIDASMLCALLQAMLDWGFEHARTQIEFRVDVKASPVRARLACRFAYIPADELAAQNPAADLNPGVARLDTIPWQLLRRLAQTLGLLVQREDAAGSTQLTFEFPHTVNDDEISLTTLEFDDPAAAGANSQQMVGRHVLVVAGRRDTRNSLRETLRPLGLMVDYVNTVDEAREFCRDGLPHAVIFESALAGETFRKLRAEWISAVPTLAFIEIGEQGREVALGDLGDQRATRIGRDVIDSALPSALMLELAKGG